MNILTVFAAVIFITAGLASRLRRLAFFPLIRWPVPARLCLTFPVAVTLSLLLRPLCDFCFGISADSFKNSKDLKRGSIRFLLQQVNIKDCEVHRKKPFFPQLGI
jgi:hypothetical protein